MNLIIRNGTVVDGSGTPRFKADVAVEDRRISHVGRVPYRADAQEIDATGKIVAPGFIDIHTHSDLTLLLDGSAESLLTQGVTTQVVGNCGMSVAPVLSQRQTAVTSSVPFLLSGITCEIGWASFSEYLDQLESVGLAHNVAAQVGHGTLRANITEMEDVPLDGVRLRELQKLTAQVLEQGAMGITTGLIYPPGSFASLEELLAITEVVAEYGSLYASHLRGYRALLEPSVKEAVGLGKTTGASIHLSHLKAAGKVNRNRHAEILGWIDNARNAGLDVTFDVYPYEAGNTTLLSIFPRSLRAGGTETTRRHLADAETRKRLRESVFLPEDNWEPLLEPDEWQSVSLVSFRRPENKHFEGQNLQSIAEELEMHPLDAACELLLAEDLVLNMVNFHVAEPDIEAFLQHPACMVASDAISVGRTAATQGIRPHPRFYGTFPRILRRYVRERGTLTLEDAVHKMCGAPAQRMRMTDRGRLQEGAVADLVVFDAATVTDQATYEQPDVAATGIDWVLVGGEVVCKGGVVTAARPGHVVRA